MKTDETDPRASCVPLIDGVVRRATAALVWERAWPPLAAALAIAVLFLTVSWLGLWDALPPLGRMAGVALFAFGAIATLVPLVRLAAPGRRAALARVDRASGLTHRPATSLDDRLAGTAGEDAFTRALWSAHRERTAREAKGLRAGAPAPGLAARDPYALRFALGLVAVAAFAYAGADREDRVLAAFDWTRPAAEAIAARVDAWVAPPGYTGRPPIFLTGRAAGAEPADAAAAAVPEGAAEAIRAPENSTLVIRGSGGAVDVAVSGAAEPVEGGPKPPEGVTERRFKLAGDAQARVTAAGAGDRSWRFSVIADEPPAIKLSGPLKMNARGTATVAYEVKDDYGVAGAEARFALKDDRPAAKKEGAVAAARKPLYDAPKVKLGLPRAKARDGKAEAPLDVMEHPFAGAEATMTLVARDEAGQEGTSEALKMRLPARAFTKPLARALVEQRRFLALDAYAKPRVLTALKALAMFPDQFTPDLSVYLGLTTAYRRLENAHDDDRLRAAADYLWEIALRIEDGDLPEAERDVRAAEQALRKALEEGASEQEIAKLTQDLRAALEKFMREMAQQAQRQQQGQPPQQGQQNGQAVRPQDLRDMVDRMEQLSKQGAKDAARQALAELRDMLDNLKTAQRQQSDPNAQAMQQQMNKLQDMIREQSKLRDKTFQQFRQGERQQRNQRQQQRRQPGQQPQQGGNDAQDMKDLAQQQQQLRQKLDEMMKEMQQGQDGQQGQQQGKKGRPQGKPGEDQDGQQGPGEQAQGGKPGGEQSLGEAGESMGEAQGSLGKGQSGEALDQQQKALENLRKGAQALAEQMQQQGQGQPGQQAGQPGQQGQQEGEEGRDDDPLGRPVRRRDSDGTTTKVPGEIEAQRARRVLEELRRRLGEQERPRDELDYLERLLTP